MRRLRGDAEHDILMVETKVKKGRELNHWHYKDWDSGLGFCSEGNEGHRKTYTEPVMKLEEVAFPPRSLPSSLAPGLSQPL